MGLDVARSCGRSERRTRPTRWTRRGFSSATRWTPGCGRCTAASASWRGASALPHGFRGSGSAWSSASSTAACASGSASGGGGHPGRRRRSARPAERPGPAVRDSTRRPNRAALALAPEAADVFRPLARPSRAVRTSQIRRAKTPQKPPESSHALPADPNAST